MSLLVPLQTRDWNEELQTTRELPRKNLPERLLRERAIFKVRMALGARPPQFFLWPLSDLESTSSGWTLPPL